MQPGSGLIELTTVGSSFHAKVLVARLAQEGIRAELRGDTDGPYPIPSIVSILVTEDDIALAREILLADAVDAALLPASRRPRQPRRSRWSRLRRREGR